MPAEPKLAIGKWRQTSEHATSEHSAPAAPGEEHLLPAFDRFTFGQSQAEAMTTICIEVGFDWNLRCEQRLAKPERIGNGHRRVVLGMTKESGRRVRRH